MKALFVLWGWVVSLIIGSFIFNFSISRHFDFFELLVVTTIMAFLSSLPALIFTFMTALLIKSEKNYFAKVQIAHIITSLLTYLVFVITQNEFILVSIGLAVYFGIGFCSQYYFFKRSRAKIKNQAEISPLDDLSNL